MTRTDDFFADLETQLREAQQPAAKRPNRFARAWRPALTFAAVAAVVIGIVVGIGGGTGNERDLSPAGDAPRMVIDNHSGRTAAGPELARVMKGAGFEVIEIRDLDVRDRSQTEVIAASGYEDAASDAAEAMGLPRDRIATNTEADVELTVVLTPDVVVTDSETATSSDGPVSLFDASGRPGQDLALEALMSDRDFVLDGVGSAGVQGDRERTAVLAADESALEYAAQVKAALSARGADLRVATPAEREAAPDVLVQVLIGRDYELPQPYRERFENGEYVLPGQVRVAVLSESDDAARLEAAEKLRDAGYDVTADNGIQTVDGPSVYFTRGNRKQARRVAQLVGVPDAAEYTMSSGGGSDVEVFIDP